MWMSLTCAGTARSATLGHLGRIGSGRHTLETPVGNVAIEYDGRNRASIQNVPSYRFRKAVAVDVPGHGKVVGDIAWGGNWFFLVGEHGEQVEQGNVERLTAFTWQIRQQLERAGITGADGGPIDHIELFAPPRDPANHSRNFVLCPGKAYDRSPCGTGTSAKVACLIADGKLKPGEVWRQESILGSVFEATGELHGDQVLPTITGTSYITAEATLIVEEADPFATGVPAGGNQPVDCGL